eukprot:4986701-Prymnesium_polylepis.1
MGAVARDGCAYGCAHGSHAPHASFLHLRSFTRSWHTWHVRCLVCANLLIIYFTWSSCTILVCSFGQRCPWSTWSALGAVQGG